VSKSEEEIRQFFGVVSNKPELLEQNVDFQCLSSPTEDLTVEAITEDLNKVLTVLDDNIWMHLDVMSFFDEGSKQTMLTGLHLMFLTEQVSSCFTRL
jgi:hypothetical protein